MHICDLLSPFQRFKILNPVVISLLKVNNRNIRTRCETCSKLTVVNLEHILFLLWTACWEMFTKYSMYGFRLILFPTVIFSSFNITFTGFLSKQTFVRRPSWNSITVYPNIVICDTWPNDAIFFWVYLMRKKVVWNWS